MLNINNKYRLEYINIINKRKSGYRTIPLRDTFIELNN